MMLDGGRTTLRSKLAKLPNHRHMSYIGQLRLCLYEHLGVMSDSCLINKCVDEARSIVCNSERPRLVMRDVHESVGKIYKLSNGIMRLEINRLKKTHSEEEASRITADMYIDSAGRFYHVYVNMIRSLSTQVNILDAYMRMVNEAYGEKRALSVAAARLREHMAANS